MDQYPTSGLFNSSLKSKLKYSVPGGNIYIMSVWLLLHHPDKKIFVQPGYIIIDIALIKIIFEWK